MLCWLLWLLPAAGVQAADPTYQLEGGGTVVVDPNTKHATVTKDGVTTPLYDGTHRTTDGNVVIIRQGVATIPRPPPPPPPRPETPAEQWEGTPIVGYSPCEKLVRKTCGKENQCLKQDSCKLARQLLDMETAERDESDNRNLMTYSSGQCIDVTPDTDTFPLCGTH
jgi:hypothetical protein